MHQSSTAHAEQKKLLNKISVEITKHRTKDLRISKIDLDYAYGQMMLSKETS